MHIYKYFVSLRPNSILICKNEKNVEEHKIVLTDKEFLKYAAALCVDF